ncbi:MAG: hypothetical protein Q8R83_09845 [Legionellaceae bacterium]|nr:hypothetical protein [Legionellaceae bacterium]
MAILSKKRVDTSLKDRYDELLEQHLQSHEAKYIVYLEYKNKRSNEEDRMLTLLYDSATRPYAEVLLNLEASHKKHFHPGIVLKFLKTNTSDDIKAIVANQYRKHALKLAHYKPWLQHCETVSDLEALWYPYDLSTRIHHLNEKTSKTTQEERFLQLIFDESTKKQAIDIIILENLAQPSSYEKTYLELLLNPSTRDCARKILDLTTSNNKTLEQRRELILLTDEVTRPYTASVLEKDQHPYEHLSPVDRDILKYCFLHVITPTKPFGKRIQSTHASLSFLSSRTEMTSRAVLKGPYILDLSQDEKKKCIQDLVDLQVDEIINIYLEKTNANATVRSKGIDPTTSKSIKEYKDRNKERLSFSIIRYFYIIEQKFSEQKLIQLVTAIKNKIHPPFKNNLCGLANEAIDARITLEALDTAERLSPNPSSSNLSTFLGQK